MTAHLTIDARLLAGVRRQEPKAVQQLQVMVFPSMVAAIQRRGFDRVQAEWLAQDVFVDFVYRWVERLEEPRAVERYLRAMCLTAIRQVARRSARQVPIDEHEGADLDAASRMGRAVDSARLGPCVDQLTPRTRQRLQQHYQQERSMAAIARSEGVSAPAVRKSIVKALDALRRCLGVES